MSFPKRRNPVHLPPLHNRILPLILFVTVCSSKRRRLFNNNEFTSTLIQAWEEAGAWRVGHGLAMPDHIHFFCSPASQDSLPLKNWITFWKSLVTRSLAQVDRPIWQRHFWDTQLRTGDSYSAKWRYVQQNPVRAGLVEISDEWPWSGQENVLLWQDG